MSNQMKFVLTYGVILGASMLCVLPLLCVAWGVRGEVLHFACQAAAGSGLGLGAVATKLTWEFFHPVVRVRYITKTTKRRLAKV